MRTLIERPFPTLQQCPDKRMGYVAIKLLHTYEQFGDTIASRNDERGTRKIP